MADQAINALPTKTSPSTGDKMLMIGAAEEYQIDYDQLADAILNKLTSKTYTLDQGTKSFVAALNELNSKIDTDILITQNIINFSLNASETKVLTIELGSEIINNYLPIHINNVTNGSPLMIGNSWISGNSYKISVTNNADANINNANIVICFLAKSLA